MPELTPMLSPKTVSATAERPKRRKRNLRWISLVEPFEAGNYLVVPLTCSDDLRDEGDLMSHCVGNRYHRWCYDGAVRIFSIRDFEGRRQATVSIYYDFDEMRWRLEQCKGYGNAEVCETVVSGNGDRQNAELSDIHFLVQYVVVLYQRAQELTV
jgi:hypothetical protein